MPPKKNTPPIQQTAIGDGNVQVAGDNNTVNQTIIQKFFNIFRSDAETVDQRNRRIMLGHVENFWVKGILEKSLHGAALLDLGIKEDPDAVTYPWAIKREANKETLPAGTSMLEIFQEIGMGRSLLILGAPGSGKTTMLLELTRQLIERAREDVTEPIPVVFNLSSWTEKLTLADWLARELNNIYYVPKKIAPTWVKENKMLPLLDGLDEVKQESRDKCVDAINQFRKENGLTSMTVCSRIQDYAELKTRLTFNGAIEIQPLTPDQVNEYFKRLGKGLAGIRQVLDKDTALREMAETPLFLSIMTLAYRDTQSENISISDNSDLQRKHLFDTYIERMFERPERSKNEKFKKHNVLSWLSWLAKKMIEHHQVPYLIENMQPSWLGQRKPWSIRLHNGLSGGQIIALYGGSIYGPIYGLIFGLTVGLSKSGGLMGALLGGAVVGMIIGLIVGLIGGLSVRPTKIDMVDTLGWDWKQGKEGLISGFQGGLIIGLIVGLVLSLTVEFSIAIVLGGGLFFGLLGAPIGFLIKGVVAKSISQTTYPGQRIYLSKRNFVVTFVLFGLIGWIIVWLFGGLTISGLRLGLIFGQIFGLSIGLRFGGGAIIQHSALRFSVNFNNLLPEKLVPFLDHCTDLIFLRRVGGGYIFVHRLLMEHFAEMYPVSDK